MEAQSDLQKIKVKLNNRFLVMSFLAFILIPEVHYGSYYFGVQWGFIFIWGLTVAIDPIPPGFHYSFVNLSDISYIAVILVYLLLLVLNLILSRRYQRTQRLGKLFRLNMIAYFTPTFIITLFVFLIPLINSIFFSVNAFGMFSPANGIVGLTYFFIQERRMNVSFEVLEKNIPTIRDYITSTRSWLSQMQPTGLSSEGSFNIAEFDGKKYAETKDLLKISLRSAKRGANQQLARELSSYSQDLQRFETSLKNQGIITKIFEERRNITEELNKIEVALGAGTIADLHKKIPEAGKSVKRFGEQVNRFGLPDLLEASGALIKRFERLSAVFPIIEGAQGITDQLKAVQDEFKTDEFGSLTKLNQAIVKLGEFEQQATKLNAIDFASKISQWKFNLLKLRGELQEILDQKAGVTSSAQVTTEIQDLLNKFNDWNTDKSQKKID
jgi:hypothetical protein